MEINEVNIGSNRYGSMIRYGEYRLPDSWVPEDDEK